MRTVIFVGFITISSSINTDWYVGQPMGLYATIFIFCIFMDLIEFAHKLIKR
jgi:hypothetical protein